MPIKTSVLPDNKRTFAGSTMRADQYRILAASFACLRLAKTTLITSPARDIPAITAIEYTCQAEYLNTRKKESKSEAKAIIVATTATHSVRCALMVSSGVN